MAELIHDIKYLEELSSDILKARSPRECLLAQDAFEVQCEVIAQSLKEYIHIYRH